MNYTYNVMKKSNAFSYVRTIIKFPFSNCHFLKKKAYLTFVSADPLLTYISETCGKLISWILIYIYIYIYHKLYNIYVMYHISYMSCIIYMIFIIYDTYITCIIYIYMLYTYKIY